MKIYTRTGDLGETGLFGGPRLGKDAARIEAYGTLDELNAVLGLVRAEPLATEIVELLARVQAELFQMGAELAAIDPVAKGTRSLAATHVEALEAEIDRWEQTLPPLRNFILPAGVRAAALLHLARAVCRRAERRLVRLIRSSQEPISLVLLSYLNRLGDLLFVLARVANQQAGMADIPWKNEPPK
jgi:cob(I)alamin adenosyltransferase